jgi:hypothetical protein
LLREYDEAAERGADFTGVPTGVLFDDGKQRSKLIDRPTTPLVAKKAL